jgi:hypothetical protein
MKKLLLTTSAVVASLAATILAQPATSPLQLKVTKNNHATYTTRRTESWVDGSEGVTDREISETVSYTVDVMNMSGLPLTNVQFRWAVLINRPGKPLHAEMGKKSHDFKAAEKFNFDAGPIELRTHTAKVEGYYVEALADGKVIASDIEPADIKDRITALAPKQVTHRK